MRKIGRRVARKAGIIGYPLAHSLSPVFQQAAFDYYGLNVTYEKWEVTLDRLEEAVARLRSQEHLGSNVTIPYKEAAVPLLDEIAEMAASIGAVNTIVNKNGKLIGYNTDAIGFLRALDEDASYDPDGKRVVLIGAGGAARAVAVALLTSGAASLTIVNRDDERARSLAAALARAGFEDRVLIAPLERGSLSRALDGVDLVVNTTPVGMRHGPCPDASPLPDDLVPGDALIFDLVYNPPATRLLAVAGDKGSQTLNGLPMLVYQGAASFELWTGEKAPLGLMFDRVRLALYGRLDV